MFTRQTYLPNINTNTIIPSLVVQITWLIPHIPVYYMEFKLTINVHSTRISEVAIYCCSEPFVTLSTQPSPVILLHPSVWQWLTHVGKMPLKLQQLSPVQIWSCLTPHERASERTVVLSETERTPYTFKQI